MTKYKNMREYMLIEFLRKFDNRGIKIARVNSILVTKSTTFQLFTLILFDAEVRCDRRRFSVFSPLTEKSMEYDIMFLFVRASLHSENDILHF